jgi:hypothetical protein
MSTIKPTQALLDVATENSLGYLACAYSASGFKAIETARAEEITLVFDELRNIGINTYSPITASHYAHTLTNTTGDWESWKSLDSTMLSKCDYILVYETNYTIKSKGVREELIQAINQNKPILFMNDSTRDVSTSPHRPETREWLDSLYTRHRFN